MRERAESRRFGATSLGRRVHIIRETVDGCSRGWCGRIVVMMRSIDGPASLCRRCAENQATAPRRAAREQAHA